MIDAPPLMVSLPVEEVDPAIQGNGSCYCSGRFEQVAFVAR